MSFSLFQLHVNPTKTHTMERLTLLSSPPSHIPFSEWGTLRLAAPLTARPRVTARSRPTRRLRAASSDAAIASAPAAPAPTVPLAEAKAALLRAVAGTQRGSEASSLKRGEVEEAQVAVEAASPPEADWSLLAGTWDVVYTTAGDVLPLVRPGPGLPGFPLRVGRVGQRFSSPEEGRCQNLIEVEGVVPPLTGTSATFIVEASYEVRTARSLALRFERAGVGAVAPGDDLQNALAPPLLPRGAWNMQLLQAVQGFSAFVPLTTRLPGTAPTARLPTGLNYSVTFLDEDLFIGRAGGNGGTFIFQRRQE